MMWNDLVHRPARAFQRACVMKLAVQISAPYPSMVANQLRSDLFSYRFLLQLTGNVYNLYIDLIMRRASSRQHCNP
jgi:hypothetical protein